MAGIGVQLNRIFDRHTIGADLIGFGYSSVVTVAPMFVVIGAIGLIQWALNYAQVGYYDRELFADTVLYLFIFSLLCASPFNAVLSKYLSDTIFEERFSDILSCYYVGLVLNLILGCALAIPFCIHEAVVGKVPLYYVFTGYCGFLSLLLVFYSMLYLSITKDYRKISFFFLIGMVCAVAAALFVYYRLHWMVTYSILFAITLGFFIIACLEYALIRSYFRVNSRKYREVLHYFKQYWQLVVINFLYTLGLYIHNFVFWSTKEHQVIARSFVTHMNYDMATCLAMFTNISATIIFISRIEMQFHERYRLYSEAVIGGRGIDIRNTKSRMFRQMAEELMNLARIQFIITVVIFLACIVLLPQLGFGNPTMRMYHSLALGYFILFLMYSEILFLYYFDDLHGAMWTSISFCLVTFLGSILATRFSDVWYGSGVVLGALTGFSIAYRRLRWLERNLDVHIFCRGSILKHQAGVKPSGKVFDRRLQTNKRKEHAERTT